MPRDVIMFLQMFPYIPELVELNIFPQTTGLKVKIVDDFLQLKAELSEKQLPSCLTVNPRGF